MGLITVKNLELGYGGKAVLKDLNFEIDEQDFICVVGPNGAGKTTLVRGILGLIAPMEGEINFEGVRRNHIGYISQENMINPNFPASVFEVVLSGSLNEPRNFYDSTIKKHAEEKLKLLKIGDLKDSSFAELSGGQRQKVLLARALMATKKLLILDEPSNTLDQESKESLYDFIKVLNIKQKIAIIMITHDLDHGNLIGNKILSLRDKDYFFGTTEDFVRKVHHE